MRSETKSRFKHFDSIIGLSGPSVGTGARVLRVGM
jgi:hypothetical protein